MSGHDELKGQQEGGRGTDATKAPLDDVVRKAVPEGAPEITRNVPDPLDPCRGGADRWETEVEVLAMQIALAVRNCVYLGCPMAGELEDLAGRLMLAILDGEADVCDTDGHSPGGPG